MGVGKNQFFNRQDRNTAPAGGAGENAKGLLSRQEKRLGVFSRSLANLAS
jgi:hypothetical protein